MQTANEPADRAKAIARVIARFMEAASAEDYQTVREAALAAAGEHRDIGAVRLAVIAANCSCYIAEEGEGTEPERVDAGLAGELAGLSRRASDAWAASADDGDRENLLKLVTRCFSRAGALSTVDDTARDWREVAEFVERAIPVGLTYSAESAGPHWRRASYVDAKCAAQLSLAHGEPMNASDRLVAALDAFDDDAIEFSMLAQDAYSALRAAWVRRPSSVVAVLHFQSALMERMDGQRGRYRSRAGRLYIAQVFDGLASAFKRDMLEPTLPPMPKDHPATEQLFSVLRGQLLRTIEFGKSRLLLDQRGSGTRPFASAAAADAAHSMERRVLALPSNTNEDPRAGREVQLVSRLPMVFWQTPMQNESAYRAVARRVAEVEKAYAESEAGLVDVEPRFSLDYLPDELGEREALVIYTIPRDTLHPAPAIAALVVTRDGVHGPSVMSLGLLDQHFGDRGAIGSLAVAGREPIEASALAELVLQARLSIQKATESAPLLLRLLNQILIEPLQSIGIKPENFDHWHIVPDGVLHAVPFRALVDEAGAFLNTKVSLSVVPSASLWVLLRQPWAGLSRFTGFAYADAHGPRPLKYAAKELQEASARLGSLDAAPHFTNGDATVAAFVAHARGSSILHVAAHGEFPERDVIDFHRLRLAPDPCDDGDLTAARVRECLLHDTRLAVLSVCDGGLYRVGVGDELYGIVPAFLEAGASNVLTTLWAIDDLAARLWMREFYAPLLNAGPARAAQVACEAMIARKAKIRDWAGYTLVGGSAGGPGCTSASTLDQ